MKSCNSDPAMNYKMLVEELIKMCATYVDETLHFGNYRYSDLVRKQKNIYVQGHRLY